MLQFEFPSILSYTGSIQTGMGLYFALLEGGQKVPVVVEQSTIKGVMASYKEIKDLSDAKGAGKAVGRSNIQSIDRAILPPDTAAFHVAYSVTFSPNAMGPNACNDVEASNALKYFTRRYFELGGANELAMRYVANILRGAWLWRNAGIFCEGRVQVDVKYAGKSYVFTNESINAKSFMRGVAGAGELVGFVDKALSGQYRDIETGYAKSLTLRGTATLDASAG